MANFAEMESMQFAKFETIYKGSCRRRASILQSDWTFLLREPTDYPPDEMIKTA